MNDKNKLLKYCPIFDSQKTAEIIRTLILRLIAVSTYKYGWMTSKCSI